MSQPNLRSLNEEISNIGNLHSSFRERFADFSRRLEESGDPQSENAELKNVVKWLSHQNSELQRQHDDHRRDSAKLVDARNAALRKLDNAYKVIRDLIEERNKSQAIVESQLSPSRGSNEEREGKRQVVEEALAMRSSPDTSTNSDRTVRQLEHASSHLSTPRPTPSIHRPHSAETRSKSGRGLPSPETSGSESEPSDSFFSSPLATMLGDDDGRWSIHYGNRIPRASNMSFGPVTHAILREHSTITSQDVVTLEQHVLFLGGPLAFANSCLSFSLVVAGDLCLQIHITANNLVFLNDPMFLEEESEDIKNTFILGWGDREANAKLSRYIGSKSGQTFHTFVFPDTKRKWYYVGGFTFQIASPVNVWAILASKRKVLSKLAEQSNFDEGEIAARLDDGRLSQVCIEISSDGLWDESKAFALKLGFEPPPSR